VADPLLVPVHKASDTEAIEYVVVSVGETVRSYEPVRFDCVKPSDHVTDHGAAPVRAT
jgi:hypothetical protein